MYIHYSYFIYIVYIYNLFSKHYKSTFFFCKQNNHCEFIKRTHKLNKLKLILNVGIWYLRYTNLNNYHKFGTVKSINTYL